MDILFLYPEIKTEIVDHHGNKKVFTVLGNVHKGISKTGMAFGIYDKNCNKVRNVGKKVEKVVEFFKNCDTMAMRGFCENLCIIISLFDTGTITDEGESEYV